ncbi:cell wall metabolism sensor histidine kinase WalK [Thalassobacillus sp. CUG 92003]|uniref:sensor histidine kinase n=1 Tax=Thalassobacillus sp. CUG 92003 TaxID=2736641 RepID=UPI0015E7D9FF|nr:HAMP domain-containing sensor histidine kinase [Thalassobacillus sp. CUG 92003]
MVKFIYSFRSKMIFLFGLSMLLAGIISYLIFKTLQWYYHNMVDYEDALMFLRLWISRMGDINVFLIFFIPLAVLFFYLLTKPYSTYFREISTGIHQLARGDLTHRVHIQSHDEFQEIAKDINMAGQKLEEAIERGDFSESSKDQLIVNLAHDLRTPLTSVLGYLDLILKDSQLTPEQKDHYLRISYTKSQRLERLIDELFETTRMNYGMMPLEKNSINMSELIYQISEEMYPIFEKNHLEVRLDVVSELLIDGDGEQLARVFENLLINASRYGADGLYVDINGFREDNEIVIQIINYGDHIPEEELPYLFEMFYKGDPSRTHKESSTGLGLYIAKNIIKQHEGSISVDSNVIRTQFEVRLPGTKT